MRCTNKVTCKPVTLARHQESIKVAPVEIKPGQVVEAKVVGWDIDYHACDYKPLLCIPAYYKPIKFECISVVPDKEYDWIPKIL